MTYWIARRFDGKEWTFVGLCNGIEVCRGSHTSVTNDLREMEKNEPKPERLTQQQIDGDGKQRNGFLCHLLLLKNAIKGTSR